MKNKKTVILFTNDAKADNAQAIKDFLAKDKDKLPIIIAEEELQGIAVKLIKDRFLQEESTLKKLYDSIQAKMQQKLIDKKPSQEIVFKANNPAYNKAFNILTRYNPNLIILTSAGVMKEVIAARLKAIPDTSLILLIDEFVLDKRLINKYIDHYFVTNMAVKTSLVNEGISEEKITLCDFPVSQDFDKNVNKEELFAEYKFDTEKPTVLLAVPQMPGGGSSIKNTVDVLQNFKNTFNIVADCGKNRELLVYARDRGIKAINEGRDSAPLYTVADIVISRPSASVIAKTFYKNGLFFSLACENELERRTFAYLKDYTVDCKSDRALTEAMQDVLDDPKRFDTVADNVKDFNMRHPRGVLLRSIELLAESK